MIVLPKSSRTEDAVSSVRGLRPWVTLRAEAPLDGAQHGSTLQGEVEKCCTECRESKPLSEFHRRTRSPDGFNIYCKACVRERRRRWRPAQNEARRRWQEDPANREKVRAHRTVGYAISVGQLERPRSCERCGGPSPHAHHPDYSDPLAVEWLCAGCHAAAHSGEKAA